MPELQEYREQLLTVLADFKEKAPIQNGQLIVIGCSTSEVIGEKIGTAGNTDVAEMIFSALSEFQKETGVELAFQCCEHLNRALVVERETAEKRNYEIVSVIPIPKAGGSMAAFAYEHMRDPVVVEFIKADAGIDIGDTLIGMHLKHVAVPVRSSVKQVGQAHVNLAFSRPKLIGGARAVYTK